MNNFSIILSTVAVTLAAVAIVAVFKNPNMAPSAPAQVAVASGAISQADLAAALTQNPKLVADAMQAYEQMQREEQEKAAAARLQQYAGEISSDANVPSVGPKDAKVVVTEFYDFSCGFCKRLAPELEQVIAANPDVKFVFKPLTFVSPVSSYQAKAGFAADNQGKFLEFYTAVMNGDASNEEAVDEIAANLGLDIAKFKADVADDSAAQKINDVASFAQKIEVNGVPALFVNGKQINGRTVDEIQASINEAK